MAKKKKETSGGDFLSLALGIVIMIIVGGFSGC